MTCSTWNIINQEPCLLVTQPCKFKETGLFGKVILYQIYQCVKIRVKKQSVTILSNKILTHTLSQTAAITHRAVEIMGRN